MNSYCLIILLGLFYIQNCAAVFSLRRLIGSNCILIERGDVPPYYDCVGCIIEQAQGCLTDMRSNLSENVATSCKMYSASEKVDRKDCCPKFATTLKTGLDLVYVGAAYPMALRCIKTAGCEDSVIYTQLMEECQNVCPASDPRVGGTVCLSDFNSGSSIRISILFSLLSIVIALLMMALYS